MFLVGGGGGGGWRGGVVEVVADDVEVEAAEKMKVVINYCVSALEK